MKYRVYGGLSSKISKSTVGLVFAATLGLTTAAVVGFSSAQSISVGTLQGEAMRTTSSSVVQEGSVGALKMDSKAAAAFGKVITEKDTTTVSVTMRGDQCKGSPRVRIKVDGNQVLTTYVESNTYKAYDTKLSLKAGTHMVTAIITNFGAWTKGKECSRAVYLDSVSFTNSDVTPTPVPPTPPVVPPIPPTPPTPPTPPVVPPTPPVPPVGDGSYVQPGTQGYRGALSALANYSAANGQVPNSSCSWDQTYKYLRCNGNDLTLTNAYVQGGIYWTGCGKLNIDNSVVDWAPSKTWHNIQAACQNPSAGSSITVTRSTLQTGPGVPTYTGGSDIGAINVYGGNIPMLVSNSLLQGFPQGLDPGANSVIKDNEIYTKDAQCSGGTCHGDGLFSQGGSNITYEGNYIVVPTASTTTAAIFWQGPHSTGNKVIGNYLKGGAYTFYNQTSFDLVVQNNTFGGGVYGDATNCGAGSCGSIAVWTGNVKENGAVVPKP